MELCTRGLGGSVAQLKSRNVQLSCVRTLVVVAEERPRIALCNSFTALFAPLGLSPRAVSTSFGCRQNIAICLQVCMENSYGDRYPNSEFMSNKYPIMIILCLEKLKNSFYGTYHIEERKPFVVISNIYN